MNINVSILSPKIRIHLKGLIHSLLWGLADILRVHLPQLASAHLPTEKPISCAQMVGLTLGEEFFFADRGSVHLILRPSNVGVFMVDLVCFHVDHIRSSGRESAFNLRSARLNSEVMDTNILVYHFVDLLGFVACLIGPAVRATLSDRDFDLRSILAHCEFFILQEIVEILLEIGLDYATGSKLNICIAINLRS